MDCNILFCGRIVGKAQVEKVGLYYQFRCLCRLPTGGIYRLIVNCRGETANLGICVLANGEYVLSTKIAAKRLPTDDFTIQAISKEQAESTNQQKEILRLEDLDNAYLAFGKVYVKN